MAIALLDVNVLIALLDSNHVFHEQAHQWWATQMKEGWASCPLTENGVVRVMTQPAYSPSQQFSPRQILDALKSFQRETKHTFWPDAISLLDETRIASELIVGHRQLTDVYLLALAVANAGTLVTFDSSIPGGVVRGFRPEHRMVLNEQRA